MVCFPTPYINIHVFVCYDKAIKHATAASFYTVAEICVRIHMAHTHFQMHLENNPDLRPVARVEHSEKEYPVGPLGARKVLSSPLCVHASTCA